MAEMSQTSETPLRPAADVISGGDTSALDRDLLRTFIAGNASERDAAFASLVRRHGTMVAGTCRRVAGDQTRADDAAQAVFMVLVRKASDLLDHPSLGAWLHRTARQAALQMRQAENVRARREEEAMRSTSRNQGIDDLSRGELREEIDEALDDVHERYRLPLILHYLAGLPQEEIASQLQISIGTVSSALTRGRRILRSKLLRRGITVSLAMLGAILAEEAAEAMSQDLANAVLGTVRDGLPGSAGAQGITHSLETWASTTAAASPLMPITAIAVLTGVLVISAVAWLPGHIRHQRPAASVARPAGVPLTVLAPHPAGIQSVTSPVDGVAVPTTFFPANKDHPPGLAPGDWPIFDHWPQKVQHAVTNEAAGRLISGLKSEDEDGHRQYHAHFTPVGGGPVSEIVLSGDGHVVEREKNDDDAH